MTVFVRMEFLQSEFQYNYKRTQVLTAHLLTNFISSRKGIPAEELKLVHNKHYVSGDCVIPDGAIVRVLLSLPGGKGGFGSMLRAIGAQIEKTTNREACRDLSGRRLRDINEESRLKQWIAKQAERDSEAAQRKKSRLERLRTLPKHDFHDPDYDRQRSELPERIDDALTVGLKKSSKSNGLKRKSDSEGATSKKKPSPWFDDLEELGSGSSEGSSSEDVESAQVENTSETSNTSNTERISDAQPLLQAKADNKAAALKPEALDLLAIESITDLEALGLDQLKSALLALGMKCGGTLQQRAERLWAVRGVEPKKIDPVLLAKSSKPL